MAGDGKYVGFKANTQASRWSGQARLALLRVAHLGVEIARCLGPHHTHLRSHGGRTEVAGRSQGKHMEIAGRLQLLWPHTADLRGGVVRSVLRDVVVCVTRRLARLHAHLKGGARCMMRECRGAPYPRLRRPTRARALSP